MTRQSLRPFTRAIAVAMMVLTPLPACYSPWQVEFLSPQSAPPRGTLRVTFWDGTRLVLHEALLRNDSLVGVVDGYPPRNVAVPRAKVAAVESRHLELDNTAGLALGASVLALTLVGVIGFATWQGIDTGIRFNGQ